MNDHEIDRACLSPRHPPYRVIHKALRLAMFECLGRLGSLHAADSDALMAALDEVEGLVGLCEGHLAHEDRFMHPPLRARSPGQVAAFDAEHAAQAADIAALRRRIRMLRRATADHAGHLHALYLALSTYVAGQMVHMAEEETRLTEALWAHFSEDEIAGIEAELVASIEPGERAVLGDWMLRACHHAERLQLLRGMREGMPEAAFSALLDGLAGRLPATDVERLRIALDDMPRMEAA
jgi:hemerythrin-like domain-containing protein